MGKNVIMTGATGMIGSLVLKQCLESEDIDKVTCLVRRKSSIGSPKLVEVIVDDFLFLDENASYFERVDIVFYCLGAYTGTVDREQFRTINIDYPEYLARIIHLKNPGARFCLLSGAGADRSEKSRMSFAKDKGIIENRLSAMGFGGFHAFRPGYIYPVTPRKEPSLSYRLTRMAYPLIRLFGKNASVTSTQLASTMFKVGTDGCELEILENRDILEHI